MHFSTGSTLLFCYTTNHLMTGPLGNSKFFPRISMFPEMKSRKTLRFSGNKIHTLPRDQSLSVIFWSSTLSVMLLSLELSPSHISSCKVWLFFLLVLGFLLNIEEKFKSEYAISCILNHQMLFTRIRLI